MPPDIRAVPPDQSLRDRLVEVINEEGDALGLPFRFEELALEARDGDRWLGGLTGCFFQSWLYVEDLAAAQDAQGQGLGSRLLLAAEAEARARDGLGVLLGTFSFQAPGFYAKLGYEEVGRIPDYPPGHARLFLAKRLDGRPVQEGSP